MQRRLAAILAADVVGYSKLMAEDEAGTLDALRSHRSSLFDPEIEKRGGRIVKLMGDGTLVEFPSVVDAAEAAIAIQKTLAAASQQIRLRIGIHLGDVIVDGDDIYGDGVNIAARLETLASPGGVCISSIVHESIGNRLEDPFADAGKHTVKNFDRPIHVYQWPADAATERPVPAPARVAMKKTVAVLPFDNMSGGDDLEAFSDGLAEDIITALSRTSWYDVTARNSSFAYKGQSPDIREVGKALGADYVLEGSVRQSGNRARITVQLIECATGNHVWADRYDRAMDDEFAVQDEIVQRITALLIENIWQSIARGLKGKDERDYDGNECVMAAIESLHKIEPEDCERSMRLIERARELGTDLPVVDLCIGFLHSAKYWIWGDDTGTALDLALQHAVSQQEIAPQDANSYRLLSRVYTMMGRSTDAWQCVERALSINPNDGDIIGNRGICHLFHGEFDEALEWLDKVLDLHVDTPHTVELMNSFKALAHFGKGEYDAAIRCTGNISGMAFMKNLLLAACHSALDDQAKAAEHSAEIMRIHPQFSLKHGGLWIAFQREQDRTHVRSALIKAGLPE